MSCQGAVEGLRARGHDVQVLTSCFGLARPIDENHIWRRLRCYGMSDSSRPFGVIRSQLDLIRDGYAARRALSEFRPELIWIWHVGGLGSTVLCQLDLSNHPKVYDVSAYSLLQLRAWVETSWRPCWDDSRASPARRSVRSILRTVLGWHSPVEVRFPTIQFAHFSSDAIRREYQQAGISVPGAPVIYRGIDLAEFTCAGRTNEPDRPRRLLYAGRLARTKGVDVALEALAILVHRFGQRSVRLSIAGEEYHERGYGQEIASLVAELGLADHVAMLGRIPRDRMAALYRGHDILLFPSRWVEPFGRSVVEAMACGVVVVASRLGGPAEILTHGKDGLLCEPGDPHDLACQVNHLLGAPDLYGGMRGKALETVRQRFSVDRMVDELEHYLLSVTGRNLESPACYGGGREDALR